MFGLRVATLHLHAPFLSAVPMGSSRSWNVEAEFVFLVRSDLQNGVLLVLTFFFSRTLSAHFGVAAGRGLWACGPHLVIPGEGQGSVGWVAITI